MSVITPVSIVRISLNAQLVRSFRDRVAILYLYTAARYPPLINISISVTIAVTTFDIAELKRSSP